MDTYHNNNEKNRESANKIKTMVVNLGNIEYKLKKKLESENKVAQYLTKLHTDSIISHNKIINNFNNFNNIPKIE